jgi:hypothetical protein
MQETVSRFPIQKFKDSTYNFKNAALIKMNYNYIYSTKAATVPQSTWLAKSFNMHIRTVLVLRFFLLFFLVFLGCFMVDPTDKFFKLYVQVVNSINFM